MVEQVGGKGACLFTQASSMHVLSVFMMYWNLSSMVSHCTCVICMLYSVSINNHVLCLWPLIM